MESVIVPNVDFAPFFTLPKCRPSLWLCFIAPIAASALCLGNLVSSASKAGSKKKKVEMHGNNVKYYQRKDDH